MISERWPGKIMIRGTKTSGSTRLILAEAGFPWATSHSFRRTVASLIDGAEESVALAADVLGHKDASMTARYYLGCRGDTARAAAVL